MSSIQTAPPGWRRTRPTIFAALVVVALTGVIGGLSLAGSSSFAAASTVAEPTAHASTVAQPSVQAAQESFRGGVSGDTPGQHQGKVHGALGVVDGVVVDGVTVFDDEYPAVANLDPALLDALRAAAKDAGDDGVQFYVNSGWRSAAYQVQLLEDALSEYGSAAEAARWVATPATSSHVSGDAADLGDSDARTWLSKNGADYGLCQIYRNESWHYEHRPEAVVQGCPAMYADPTDDPRMR